MKSIEERIKDAEDSLPVPTYMLREALEQIATLKEESERLKAEILCLAYDRDSFKDRVAELEQDLASSKSQCLQVGLYAENLECEVSASKNQYDDLRTSLGETSAILFSAVRDGRLNEIDRMVFSDGKRLSVSEALDYANDVLGRTQGAG